MITVEEAKKILTEKVDALTEIISIKTIDALGYMIAEDIYSPLDLPPFNQSNVDGYAVFYDKNNSGSWNIIAEIKAGDNVTTVLSANEAARIFTGAMVPENAGCVIMQEKIIRDNNKITCIETLTPNEHIRKKGSQIKAGELALKKETLINPSVIGFIASLGLKEIKVFKKPIIKLIITGNELQQTGTILEPGKVYESNSASLSAALSTMGLAFTEILFVKDDKESLAKAVHNAMMDTDVLLISGGISVGDYDFVNEVLNENNTRTLFYKVAQKPGKPLYFGKNNTTYVFGLPGNPASALTCFYEYVYPCLRKLHGRKELFLATQKLPVEQHITKKKGLANFLKASVNNGIVLPLDGQESFKMRSFTDANAFIYLSLEEENIKAGDLVEVHLFPNF